MVFILCSGPLHCAIVSFGSRKGEPHMLLIMKRTVILIMAACLVYTICIFALVANAQQGDKKAKRVTVTGCLQKGDAAEEFAITGENGKNYELFSSTV